MSRPIQAVIFDLDGVVADSHPIHERAWRKLFIEEGRSEALPRLPLLIRSGRTRGEILHVIFPNAGPDELTSRGRRKDDLYREAANDLRPVPGVLPWIRELHKCGLLLAVATSASRTRTIDTIRKFGVHELFAAIVTADDVDQGKPDPALFLRAAEQLGVSANHALVIEDSEGGLRAAQSAGMLCACYAPQPGNKKFASPAPDFLLHAFDPESLGRLWADLGIEAVPASFESPSHV